MRQTILNAAFGVAHAVGADALIGRQYKGAGAILMAHSVAANREDVVDPHLQSSADFLDRLLRYYIDRGVDILSLDQAMDRLAESRPREFVCFTFDDGYRNNLTTALPVFERHAKPFTVYVTSAFIDRTIDHQWGLLRELVRRQDLLTIETVGGPLNVSTSGRKMAVFERLSRLLSDGALSAEALRAAAARCGLSERQVLDEDALDADELKQLAASPLVEIGGHTHSHPHLSALSPAEVREEISKNTAMLESMLGKPVRHFAYPYGDRNSCGEREFDICAAFGFRTATTTRIGGLFAEHLKMATALPRIRFNGGCERVAFMECQRQGAVTALMTRFGNTRISA